jgi:hypothetical protein
MTSPVPILFSARVASPTSRTVTETDPSFSPFIMLNGISSIPGIQNMRNWPGSAFAQSLSLKVKVLTVGLSVFTLLMRVVLNWLAAM